jgi:hypothetical protein
MTENNRIEVDLESIYNLAINGVSGETIEFGNDYNTLVVGKLQRYDHVTLHAYTYGGCGCNDYILSGLWTTDDIKTLKPMFLETIVMPFEHDELFTVLNSEEQKKRELYEEAASILEHEAEVLRERAYAIEEDIAENGIEYSNIIDSVNHGLTMNVASKLFKILKSEVRDATTSSMDLSHAFIDADANDVYLLEDVTRRVFREIKMDYKEAELEFLIKQAVYNVSHNIK